MDNRVESLSNNSDSEDYSGKMFFSILPLHEILSLYYDVGMNSKKIWNVYWKIIEDFKNEFNVLLFTNEEELLEKDLEKGLVDLIIKNRGGKIKVKPGYDGEYGKAILEGVSVEKQSKLF